MSTREEAVVVIKLDGSTVPASADSIAKSLGKVGQAGEISARQTAAAMRTLPAQFTDIATQLAGGQNPLLILLQQGGQIKDSFGGVGNAVKALGTFITPANLLLGGLAATLGTVALAAYKGVTQTDELRDMLALTGNAAGVTASGVEDIAQRISTASGQTVGGAREIALALAATGRTSSAVLGSQALAIARIADLSGESARKIAGTFASQLDEPAKFAAKLNEQYNFLNLAQFKRIQQLDQEGRAAEAAKLTNELLTKALEGQRDQLGTIEKLLEGTAKLWGRFWQAALNEGKPSTLKQQLDTVRGEIESLQGRLNGTDPNALVRTPDGIRNAAEQLRSQIIARQQIARELQRSVSTEQLNADARSEAAAKTRAGIKDALASSAATRKLDPAVNFDILDSRDARARLLEAQQVEEGLVDSFFTSKLQLQDERDAQLRARDAEFLASLRDQNARAGIELIADERQRGEALIALDRSIAERRLAAQVSPGARDEALRLLGEKSGLSRDKLDTDIRAASDKAAAEAGKATYNDVRNALSAAFRDSHNPAKAFANALGDAVYTRLTSSIADAIATGAVGKDGKGGIFWDLLGMFFPAIKGGGVDASFTGGSPYPGFDRPGEGLATGTNYVQRDMIVKVHRGEAVVPAKYNPAAGGAGGTSRLIVAYSPTFQVDARADQAQTVEALYQMTVRTQQEFVEHLRARGFAV